MLKIILHNVYTPSPVAQLVANPTVDPGIADSPAQPHTFMEFDHEIISMVILLLTQIQERLMSKYVHEVLVNRFVKVWLG